ncbi:MAG: hypothetical protein KJI69_03950 [Patescibacteria group bacterium]|nr:hypothetical protein [Patescibacteria group bacterium]
MYKKEDFPHEEYPEGIIRVSLGKKSKLNALIKRYSEVGFKDYDLTEIAQLSIAQWKRRDYPIPKGYKRSWGNYLTKLNKVESYLSKVS